MSDEIYNDEPSLDRAWTYLAPATLPTSTICRRLVIPNDLNIIAAVNWAIGYLALEGVWEASENVSELDMQALMSEMFYNYGKGISCMIGSLVPVITANIPAHMLLCDGATYNRVNYPDLYAVLHPSLILGADTFKVPDLRQRTVIGSDNDYPFNQAGGAATHTLTIDEMPSHDHPQRVRRSGTAGNEDRVLTSGTGNVGLTNGSIDDTGGGQAHNNMQPYRAFPYAVIAK